MSSTNTSSHAPAPLSPRLIELRHFQPSLAFASTSQPFRWTRLPLRASSSVARAAESTGTMCMLALCRVISLGAIIGSRLHQ